ncbi:cell envelope biogenesis protein AsmA [Burkholderia ubonensis]|uniref:Cell envelope biogenesis protein AsmA n=1 Tax=Burkholderia ubonensis TaxID=101571 RepID=A0A108CTH7_9BURK|nr:AsmA family protein [Burkholderia ubonensis]KWK80616.1 cell envelope biogenesis protein AsmA [Burkholderia ubonensis]
MRIARPFGKIVAALIVTVAVVVGGLAVFVQTFDWNRARPWIDDKVSEAIGRQFSINGDLRVDWHRPPFEHGWRAWVPWPRFTARNIVIANPDWARAKAFATLDAIGFDVAALPLLDRRIVIPSIELVNPSVDLERVKDGRENWTFKLKSAARPRTWTLDLHDIAFMKGRAAYYDEVKHADLKAAIDTLGQPIPFGDVLRQQEKSSRQESAGVVGSTNASKLNAQVRAKTAPGASKASGAPAASAASRAGSPSVQRSIAGYAIGWTVDGTYRKMALSGSGKVGGVLALQDARRPFPVQASLRIGDTRIALVGTLTDPAHLAALDLRLWLAGISMAHLYEISGVTLPETRPFATEGRLVGQFREAGNIFKYDNFTGRVGGSDLNGSLTYEAREPRPVLYGKTASNLLQFADLAPIIGADSNANKSRRGEAAHQPADKALPVEPFRTERWKAIDANVAFTGRRIIKNVNLPVTALDTHVILRDGVLTLDPLKFDVAGGTLASTMRLDGNAAPLKARVSMQVRHLRLKQLFPTFAVMQTSLGEINGDIALSATGNSPAALAASSNGEVKTLVTDGTVSRLLMEAAGLNVANVVYEKLFGQRDVKINCAAADLVATNGVFDSRVFALDTDDAVIDMDGNINMRDETMNLRIHPHTKGFRVISLRSPLYVRGTFKQPHVGVQPGALIARGGAVVGLGLLNPFASLIALIQPSNNRPLPCQQMLADMEKRPTAPAPGVRKKPAPAPAYMKPASGVLGAPGAGHTAEAASGAAAPSSGAAANPGVAEGSPSTSKGH